MPKARAKRSTTSELLLDARTRVAAEKHYHDLFDAAPDVILEVDSSGLVIRVNAAVEDLFGYRPQELLNQPVEVLIPEELRSVHGQHRASYAAHPTKRPMGSNLDLYARRKDGTRFAVDIVLSPIRLEGGAVHTAVVIREITARKRDETAMKEARQNADTANQAKSDFLASMSHELRSPLNTIMGYTQLLAEESVGPLNEKQRRFLGHVAKDSEHLLKLINDILDLSKIEAGHLEFNREPFGLQLLFHEVLTMTRQRAIDKKVSLKSEDHPEAIIFGDALRAKQVLINLISNALKFTPSGGFVNLTASQHGSQVAITVADSGIGISPEHQEAVFGRFYQVASTTRGGKEGTGLGLAITKSLVERMAGRIWVESEVGKGSRFTFTLDGRLSPEGSGMRVLVVEDEPLAAQLVDDYLKPEGYQVTVCQTANSAILAIEAQRPDVIILDLMMQGEPADGVDLLKRLKSMSETKDIPVIVASVLAKEVSSTISLGAVAHLTKPIRKQRLIETLREVVPSE
jgi:PAS domain S-box-containing protein